MNSSGKAIDFFLLIASSNEVTVGGNCIKELLKWLINYTNILDYP